MQPSLYNSLVGVYLMAKLDLHDAYWIVPVNPSDCLLLGMQWKDTTTWTQHSHLATIQFQKSSLQWQTAWFGFYSHMAISIRPDLDDFILLGAPHSTNCASALHTTLAICKDLRVSIAEEKTESLATTLTFLGIKIQCRHSKPPTLPPSSETLFTARATPGHGVHQGHARTCSGASSLS